MRFYQFSMRNYAFTRLICSSVRYIVHNIIYRFIYEVNFSGNNDINTLAKKGWKTCHRWGKLANCSLSVDREILWRYFEAIHLVSEYGYICGTVFDKASLSIRKRTCMQCNGQLVFSIFAHKIKKEKKKEIWPSPMTKPPIPTENSKTKGQHTQTPPKTSITQRLRTDLGRSVGVTSNPTGVVKPVHGIPTFPLTAKAV